MGEAILTAACLSNRSPSSALDVQKIPYEVWYNRKPDIDNLRMFGAFAHAYVPKQCRGKRDPRPDKNYMVGYARPMATEYGIRGEGKFLCAEMLFSMRTAGK